MNYIIYDLEATCWSNEFEARKKRQEIIEIGAVMIDKEGHISDKFEAFIRPVYQPILSPFCTELTSITQSDVAQADDFPTVVKKFQKWIGLLDQQAYLLCSWGFFDRSILAKNCHFHKLDAPWTKKHINLKDQYPRVTRTGRPLGLKVAVEKEGFTFDGIHHRGISDAENLAKIFIKYLPFWKY